MGKGSSKGHTPREAKDNLKSTQLLSVIDAISEGPIEGPVDGLKSVLLNSTPVLDSDTGAILALMTKSFSGEKTALLILFPGYPPHHRAGMRWETVLHIARLRLLTRKIAWKGLLKLLFRILPPRLRNHVQTSSLFS
ncbi:putative phage tail component [Escherichia coli]|nr:putative phage tail component [Escherichia coli]SQZ10488.1 putative phage tail component [Escherichia coli]